MKLETKKGNIHPPEQHQRLKTLDLAFPDPSPEHRERKGNRHGTARSCSPPRWVLTRVPDQGLIKGGTAKDTEYSAQCPKRPREPRSLPDAAESSARDFLLCGTAFFRGTVPPVSCLPEIRPDSLSQRIGIA